MAYGVSKSREDTVLTAGVGHELMSPLPFQVAALLCHQLRKAGTLTAAQINYTTAVNVPLIHRRQKDM